MTTFVTATEWGVSYTVVHNPLPGEARVRLNVHKTVDEVNRWGGRGVIYTHPEFDGERFETTDQAKAFAFEHGLIKVFVPGEALAKVGLSREDVSDALQDIIFELDKVEGF